jgi:hypothetical protein
MDKSQYQDNKNICNCPIDSIEYLIGVNDNNEAVDVKTGLCLRCHGIRLNKYNDILADKSIKNGSQKAKDEKKKKSNTNIVGYL